MSGKRKRRRRKRRKHPGAQRLHDTPGNQTNYGDDLYEDDQMTTPLNPASTRPLSAKEFRVKLSANEEGGFTVSKDSLMITDIQNPKLRMLPQGSIIREVDGVPVFNWEQFWRNIQGKRKYALLVILPETLGVFEVQRDAQDRNIWVHPESLTIATDIAHFPVDLQVLRCIDGVPVLNYAEYSYMTKGRSRFFITVADAADAAQSQASLSAASITECLDISKFSKEELDELRYTIDQALVEVNAELENRAREVEPRRLEHEQELEQPDHVEVYQSRESSQNKRTKGKRKRRKRKRKKKR